MRHIRPILTLFLSLSFLSSVSAQEQKGFFGRTIDRLTAPSRQLDPNAVYQPVPRWTFAITGDIRKLGLFQDNSFKTKVAIVNETLVEEVIPGLISTKLESDFTKGVGFQVGYGNLSLAWSKKFSSEGKDNAFTFDYLSAGYTVQVQFYDISQPVSYEFLIGEEGHWAYSDEFGVTENPGRLRASIVDACYAFNRRTFAYSAAYKGNLFQRKSAGSWMLGGKLMLSEFSIDPSELIALINAGTARHTSAQVSFGAGYSYNFVPFHRQPYGDMDKGLRNLTINATFLPLVTFFNQFTATSYQYAEENGYTVNRKDVMNGKLMANYVARIGVGFSYNLFTANLSAGYDSFAYKGTTIIPEIGVVGDRVNTSGHFYRWTVAVRLGMRF